jgi:hypothetical protein
LDTACLTTTGKDRTKGTAWAGSAPRDGGDLVGFVNVPWDGGVHAIILDTIVAAKTCRHGIGTLPVAIATARRALLDASGSASTSRTTCEGSISMHAASRPRMPD